MQTVQNSREELTDILDNLKITPVKSGEVDTTKLEAELNNADKVVLDAFEDGKEKAAFEAAYAAAQKVLENPTDQAAVDKAEKDLEDARKALLATSPKPEEDKEAPTKPSDLKETETTTTTVKVEWKASTDNVEVTGYNVYADGKLAETVKGDVLTAELKDLKAGTEYTIEVEAFDAAGISYEKTAVGDKYVNENMVKNGHALGGEQSGHIIFSKFATTGDGILTSIKIMEAMIEQKQTLAQLAEPVQIFPQILENVRVTDKAAAQADEDVQKAVKEVETELGDEGRILVRESGTEPLVRVMVEARSHEICREKVDKVVKVLREKGHVIK